MEKEFQRKMILQLHFPLFVFQQKVIAKVEREKGVRNLRTLQRKSKMCDDKSEQSE